MDLEPQAAGDAPGDTAPVEWERSLEALSGEVLAHILDALPPAQLHWAEVVCRRFRAIIAQHGLWRAKCLRAHPGAVELASCLDAHDVPAALHPLPLSPGLDPAPLLRTSAFFKRLCYRLTAPLAGESLLAQALAASRTDQPDNEHVRNTLNPSITGMTRCYWSSTGSQDEESCEALAFHLAHPLCVVQEVQLRPFRAWFQQGQPMYPPKAVRFRLGGLPCFDPMGDPRELAELSQEAERDMLEQKPGAPFSGASSRPGSAAGAGASSSGSGEPGSSGTAAAAAAAAAKQWVWQSPAYPVEWSDAVQRFPIPPTLCVGGYLRVELLGKMQRQDVDNAFYTCVGYVRVVGTPVYNFLPRQLPPSGLLAGIDAAGEQAATSDARRRLHQEQAGAAAGWQLAYVEPDPLVEAGGLVRVSEGGRLWDPQVQGGAEQSGSDSEEDEEEDSDPESDSSWDDSELGSVLGHSEDQGMSDLEEGHVEDGGELHAAGGGDGGGAAAGAQQPAQASGDEWDVAPGAGDAGAY